MTLRLFSPKRPPPTPIVQLGLFTSRRSQSEPIPWLGNQGFLCEKAIQRAYLKSKAQSLTRLVAMDSFRKDAR
ncbi:putative asymmetric leaves1 and rough sheath [Corchorus olitorius]|uniref:Asymmetric leaves1 and rough sheath n=1 Tax=Corchorus olitorius TaxID=93759 RepID=A0A1R3KZA5_9ROSI|nr:putative asymmetric leaves1 and rough sheath [Corchorus olitorius]